MYLCIYVCIHSFTYERLCVGTYVRTCTYNMCFHRQLWPYLSDVVLSEKKRSPKRGTDLGLANEQQIIKTCTEPGLQSAPVVWHRKAGPAWPRNGELRFPGQRCQRRTERRRPLRHESLVPDGRSPGPRHTQGHGAWGTRCTSNKMQETIIRAVSCIPRLGRCARALRPDRGHRRTRKRTVKRRGFIYTYTYTYTYTYIYIYIERERLVLSAPPLPSPRRTWCWGTAGPYAVLSSGPLVASLLQQRRHQLKLRRDMAPPDTTGQLWYFARRLVNIGMHDVAYIQRLRQGVEARAFSRFGWCVRPFGTPMQRGRIGPSTPVMSERGCGACWN